MTFKPYGIIPAMATPFTDTEDLDEAALRREVRFLLAGGVHGLFANGSQGEAYALTPAERQRVLEVVLDEAAGKVPVYAGTGAVSTRETIVLTEMAERIGVAAVSIVTPFFIHPTPDELYEHYAAVAKSTRLPIILYPNPGRTHVHLPADTAARLARIDNIVGVKDSSGNLMQTMEYIRHCGPDFCVLMGQDSLIFAALMCGAAGAIAATADVAPELTVEIYEGFKRGDLDAARLAQFRLAPLRAAFDLGTFPGVVKEAMAMLGLCSPRARGPVQPLSDAKRSHLRKVLEEIGVL
jgi:4-hydroxy-tetrahydrodipicolinate synthase